jgi:RNA polymerase sigma-70 factor (ECF subfamily)
VNCGLNATQKEIAGPSANDTERLMVEAAQQDPGRFADLYEKNVDRVYAYIARRVNDRDMAQDLTSEVFLRAFESLGRFQWRDVPFVAWLYRIALNAIFDRAKRAVKEQDILSTSPEVEVDPEDIERGAHLFQLVDGLPDTQRRVIVMRFAEDKSIREIAAELGRTEGAVKQLQFRGLRSLRDRLGARQPRESDDNG